MGGDRGVEMSPAEIDAFLDEGGTGVLALARGDRPYASPVSYGFRPDTRRFYLRLGVEPGSDRREFLAASEEARLVTYRRVEGGWSSVIAAGPIQPVDDDLTAEVAAALRAAERPLLELWGDDRDDVSFRIYRLDVEELTGRTTARV